MSDSGIYNGATVRYQNTMTQVSDGTALNLSGGSAAATMRYWYDGASATDATVDNTLDSTGVVFNDITHAQAGVFEFQWYGTDTNGTAWRSRRRKVIVQSMITAP